MDDLTEWETRKTGNRTVFDFRLKNEIVAQGADAPNVPCNFLTFGSNCLI